MSRHFHALVALVVITSAGCMCGIEPVQDCNGMPCPDGGTAGGTTNGGGTAGGGTAMGGGSTAGGMTAGGSVAGGDAGGATAGGDAGGATAGGAAGGAVAGGAVAGGAVAGGAAAGGAVAGGAVAGGAVAGGAVAGGSTAGGSTAGGTSGDGGMAYDFCGEVAARQCDFFIRCTTSGVTGFTANDQLASSQRVACEARQRADCDEAQGAYARGRTAVNLTALRSCLDAIYPSASCARDQNANTSLCLPSAYTTPLATPGTLCANDSECLAGFCNVGGGQTCGTCSAYRNADGGTIATCSRDAQCAPGTYCRNGTCAPRGGADAGCTSTGSCAAGLICPDPGLAQRFCTAGKLEGASCVKGRLECARSSGNFELVCATQFTADGGVDVCTKRFNTSPGGVCNTGEQVQGAGVPAAPTCLDTEYCDNGLCANKRMIGQPCGTNTEACVPGARCVNGTCAAFADVGGMCPTNGATTGCKEFLYCTGNTCQPQFVDAGVACTVNGNPQCIANTTYCPSGGGAVCVATKTNGTSCNASRECAGGLCVGGQCTNLCYR